MKNADMPAMPTTVKANEQEKAFGAVDAQYQGLTKREIFAMHATCDGFEFSDAKTSEEFIGRSVDWNCINDMIKASCEVSAKIKVMKADALLAELDK